MDKENIFLSMLDGIKLYCEECDIDYVCGFVSNYGLRIFRNERILRNETLIKTLCTLKDIDYSRLLKNRKFEKMMNKVTEYCIEHDIEYIGSYNNQGWLLNYGKVTNYSNDILQKVSRILFFGGR